MGKLIRCITDNGAAMAVCADTTDIAAESERIHGTSAVITAAMGRLLTAASIMGNAQKGEKDSLTRECQRLHDPAGGRAAAE